MSVTAAKISAIAAADSPSKGKRKPSSSDVQLGFQKLVVSVPSAPSAVQAGSDNWLVRLFVIPSTSGLAAGYTVGCVLMARMPILRTHRQDAERVALLAELKHSVELRAQGRFADCEGAVVLNAEDFIDRVPVKVNHVAGAQPAPEFDQAAVGKEEQDFS